METRIEVTPNRNVNDVAKIMHMKREHLVLIKEKLA